MPRARTLFLLFFVSGLCGLLYQIVWVRLAFADFGVITPVLSVVISVFMAGLSLGSWLGGRWIERWTAATGRSAIVFYGIAELLIGAGAFAVPVLLDAGEALVRPVGAMASAQYLLVSGAVIATALLPWCFFMGTTYPFMTAYIKEHGVRDESSFSYLYLANVVGALCGVLLTSLVLIELWGFRNSLLLAGSLNFAIGIVALALGRTRPVPDPVAAAAAPAAPPAPALPFSPPMVFALLFGTGFVSMAMEVIWTRAFTPILTTTIYAFASLLAVYLLATFLGTALHRALLRRGRALPYTVVLPFLAGSALLPLWLPDPRLAPYPAVALASIVPFCAGLGYLTPRLVDEYARGNPQSVGRGYAYNILGSILGPLCAGYLLLPWVGSKGALLLLAAPFLVFALAALRLPVSRRAGAALTAAAVALFAWCGLRSSTHDDGSLYERAEVRRDHTATVISTHRDGEPALLVNGIGITVWTPITKMMAHLPLAARAEPAEEALVICFGMGTTLRSIASWNVPVTAVELVPSVRDAFGFYFDDAAEVLARPDVKVVIDDGRRFLKRTEQRFDVVTIDPPPPPQTAGSSLLYSVEFYELLKRRMTDDGILQQWFPGAEPTALSAVTRAIKLAFPHVRIFRSFEGWGFHFLASKQPLPPFTARSMLAHLPAGAVRDLAEWVPESDIPLLFQATLASEVPARRIFAQKQAPEISDDRPINEYYLLRQTFAGRDEEGGNVSDFQFQPIFELGDDGTPYRSLGVEGVSVARLGDRDVLTIAPEVLRRLSAQAIRDVSHLFRPGHLQQLKNILEDPEASDNDRFVALEMLKNANISAGMVLPSCQDTGTAIVVGKKGENVFTGGNDEEALSRGIYDTYTGTNLRYSQMAPLSMYDEKNTGSNLPAQLELYAVPGDAYEFLFVTKGGGSANKTFLYQQTRAVLNPESLLAFLDEKIRTLGTSACPPYHLAVVVGGTSAEATLKTVKLASCRYLDTLPTSGNESGRAFRDRELEAQILELTRKTGIGAQFGGKYFCHDVRAIRLPRHGASCPIGIGVSCSADRQVKAKITREGVFLEQLEQEPSRFLPEVTETALPGDVVPIDLRRPMADIRAELSRHPIKTRLSLSGPMVVARDIAHAKLKERLDRGEGLPQYVKDHPIYYAGPAKTPEGLASGSFGPTTAGRMDSYVDLFQSEGGSLVTLAKGNRSKQVTAACAQHGGFYLGSIGGPAAILAKNCIKKVEVLEYPELGMEAVWKIEVENFPAFIVVDDKGNDFFDGI